MSGRKIAFEEFHGDSNFPVTVCYNSSKLYKDIVYLHYHMDIEFIYVSEGVLSLQADWNHLIVKKGEIAIINSGELHYGTSIDSSNCNIYGIIFNTSMLSFENTDICQQKYIKPFIDGNYKFPGIIKGDTVWEKQVITDVENIIAVFNNKSYGFEFKIKSLLYSIFSEIIMNRAFIVSQGQLTTQKQYKIHYLKKIISYIEANFNHKISVSDLAKELNMSEDNFYKFFKASTSKTPIEYINSYRIRIAEGLLLEKSLSIAEISLAVGFDNISYFIKTFKKYRNYSPGQLRKKFQENIL